MLLLLQHLGAYCGCWGHCRAMPVGLRGRWQASYGLGTWASRAGHLSGCSQLTSAPPEECGGSPITCQVSGHWLVLQGSWALPGTL